MSNIVETNVVEEAIDNVTKKIDKRILARPTKGQGLPGSSEVIYMQATSNVTYDKIYKLNGKPPRRVKHVKLPISLDGQVFSTIDKLFDHLVNSNQYRVENVIQ